MPLQCLFLAFKQTRQMRQTRETKQNQHATSASLQYHRFTSSTFKIFKSLRLPSASNNQNHQNPIILSWHWKSAVESGCPRCRTWDLPAHLGTKSVIVDLSILGLDAKSFFVSNSPTWHMFAWFCMCQLCLHVPTMFASFLAEAPKFDQICTSLLTHIWKPLRLILK